MTERCQELSKSESQEIDASTVHVVSESSAIFLSTDDPSKVQQILKQLKQKKLVVNAFRNVSPETEEKWKLIKAEDLEPFEPVEFSATLKGILKDYESCGDLVDRKSSSPQKNVETPVQILGGKAYERIQNKLRRSVGQINPICEYFPDIPEFKASKFSAESRHSTPELPKQDKMSTRPPFKDVTVMREEHLKQAIWKSSAVRPSSAFERKLKRSVTIGSDNLPQLMHIDAAKDVSRWPTTSTSHHSQYEPKCAERQTLSLREKSPNASKVVYDVVVAKDRSNLYNKVKDLLLTRLQDLPEDATLTSPSYVAIFFEALGLLSDGMTTYKPLLQAIISELKSVFDVQNQCENITKRTANLRLILKIINDHFISHFLQMLKIKNNANWPRRT
jgi:hypothetical protein